MFTSMSYEIGFKPGREIATQADFTYKMTPTTIAIVDTAKAVAQ